MPVYNESANILGTLLSIGDVGQTIVVDGGSTDDTVDRVRYAGLATLIASPKGRGRQLAAGAELCTGRVLVFLHGDCYLSPDALDEVVAEINRGKFWGAMRQKIRSDRPVFRALEWGNSLRVKFLGIAFGDQAIFVRADTYRSVGGFEPISLMEDVRLSQRLRRVAWPVLLRCHVSVDARRWQRRGVVRQTVLNWRIQLLHLFGASPERLERLYR